MKVNGKEAFRVQDWKGGKPLSAYSKTDYLDEEAELTLKKDYPEIWQDMNATSTVYYFRTEDWDAWDTIYSLHGKDEKGQRKFFVNYWEGKSGKNNEGYFTGYLDWSDPTVKLADIPSEGFVVSENTVTKNNIMLQFYSNKYYLEAGYRYTLELTSH